MDEISKFCGILQSHKRVGSRKWLWEHSLGRDPMSCRAEKPGEHCLLLEPSAPVLPTSHFIHTPSWTLAASLSTPDLGIGHAQVHSCCYKDILGLLAGLEQQDRWSLARA